MIVDIASTTISGFQVSGLSTVLLRVFALQSFTSNDGLRIIQPGAPNDGPWYAEIPCAVVGTTVTIPSCQLESQSDAFNPGEQGARYYAAFYRPDGSLIAPFQPLSNFQVRHDYNPATWQQIVTYNTAPFYPPQPRDTYTRSQIDNLFAILAASTPPPSAGAVTSVFARTGDIVAQSGDYDTTQITGLSSALAGKANVSHTHDASQIVSGIVAGVRLGSGWVSDPNYFLRADGTWAIPPTGSGPGGTVFSVFGRTGTVVAQDNDYVISNITGLQPALDAKAAIVHTHDASSVVSGIFNQGRLASGTFTSQTFACGDGTWAIPAGAVTQVFGRTGVITANSGDYDMSQISGLATALSGKAASVHTHDAAAIVSGLIDPNRLGVGAAAPNTYLRNDQTWQSIGVPSGELDTTANYTWTGTHTFQSRFTGNFFVKGAASKAVITVTADDGASPANWPSLALVQNGGSRITYDVSGTNNFVNIRELRLDSTGIRLRSSVHFWEASSDGTTYQTFMSAGSSSSGMALNIAATSVAGNFAGYQIGGSPVLVQAYVGGQFNTQVLANDVLTQVIGGRHVLAFNSTSLLSMAIDSDNGNGTNTPLLLRQGGSLKRVQSDTSGVLTLAPLGGTPGSTTFLRGDGSWATPSGTGPGGAVSSVDVVADNLILHSSGGPVTSSGTINLAFLVKNPNLILAGPANPASSAAVPTFRVLVAADIPALDAAQITTGIFPVGRLGTGATSSNFLRGDGTWATPSTTGSGTVTSVGLTMPSSVFSVSPASITISGIFAVTFVNQTANTVFAANSGAAPSFRALAVADIPNLPATVITSGVFPTSRLASSGTAGSGTFLRGDSTWAAPTATPPTGPVSSVAMFDSSGNLINNPTNAFITYDVNNVTIKAHGMFIDAGYAWNMKASSTGNTQTIFYGTDDWMLIGPFYNAAGVSGGVEIEIRCGTASNGRGNAPGDFYINGKRSGTVAGFFHGYLSVNHYNLSTGNPIDLGSVQPPLLVARSDNGADCIQMYQQAAMGSQPYCGLSGFGPNSASAMTQMWAARGKWINNNSVTGSTLIEFQVKISGADVAQMTVQGPTSSAGTGLFIRRPSGALQEIYLSNGGEISGFDGRVLLLPPG